MPSVIRRSAGVLLLTALAGCSAGPAAPSGSAGAAPASTAVTGKGVHQPTANAAFDYQLGGAYPPPAGTRAVSRDRVEDPVPGVYNICYVNAFQSQPGDAVAWWKRKHPGLLLRDGAGAPVVDTDWNEPLLDISTGDKRRSLAGIIGGWIDSCAAAGFDAVEPDNLDSYERSDGRLTPADAVEFARLLTRRAHRQGLAVAQKNAADLLTRRARTGFDFAVVEECGSYQECPDFAGAYDNRVFDIEYRQKDFRKACRSWGGDLSITLRDREVRPAGEEGYVQRRC
ncbi:endo alpha-1,4 polygalactosaminidase [Streptomyces sp. NBC_00344]|uniref:endo alpha-1,4 polygalactosaminidase n=1 Tax=Streptomyces sp. NBC_00344 TaxID=2975720 RepID=UPI002E216F0F